MKCIVDKLAIEYSRKGRGQIILLLHGWGAKGDTFRELALRLASKYEVISVDFPGFGGSDMPRETWGIYEYALFLRHFLKKIDVEPKRLHAVIAHSFGGRVAIMAEYHEMIMPAKNAFIGIAGIKHSNSIRNRVYKGIAKSGKSVLSLPGFGRVRHKARTLLYKSAGSSDYLEAGQMRDIFSRVINEDLQTKLPHIQARTLLLWGENDDSSPLADARRYDQLIPDSVLKVIPDTGHFVYLDEPDVTAKIVQDFLDD